MVYEQHEPFSRLVDSYIILHLATLHIHSILLQINKDKRMREGETHPLLLLLKNEYSVFFFLSFYTMNETPAIE